MTPEKTDALRRDFPRLYPAGALRFGFECGDGWEPLIRRLSERLEPIGVVAAQVKEKFAGLRFYLAVYAEGTGALIDAAAEESFRTCEHCGQPGTIRGDGWLITLCDSCEAKRPTIPK